MLWITFVIASSITFAFGNMEGAPDYAPVWIAVGITDTLAAGALLWLHGFSLAIPVILIVYVFAIRWLIFFLFLSVIFWPKAAP
jgi:hypothetical protein